MEKYDSCVRKLIEAFSDSGLDYALTGAIAVSFYGSPRTTNDIDVMVAVADETESKNKVVGALQHAGFDAKERKIDEALTSGYNIASFHNKKSPYSVDIIFSREKLDKHKATIFGTETFLQSPEGLVLAKLRMIKVTVPRERSFKDEEDVKAILAFSNVNLDTVKRKAGKEGTLNILEALVEERL